MLCTAFYVLAHCVAQTFFPVDEVMFEFNKVRKNEVMFTLTSQLINAEANVDSRHRDRWRDGVFHIGHNFF